MNLQNIICVCVLIYFILRESHQKFKNTIINAKFGGTTEANKRILAQLPVAAQSFTSTPYLDTSLFSYDEKWVSPMERPKVVGEYPIRYKKNF